jgi:hypothetical protein
MREFRSASLLALVLGLAVPVSASTPPLRPPRTLTEQRDEADVAVVAKWVSSREPDLSTGFPGESTFNVMDSLRDTLGTYGVGVQFSLQEPCEGSPGELFLIFGINERAEPARAECDESVRNDRLVNWSTPESLSDAGREYILHAPAKDDTATRLEFFADFLEHADELIARDAFAELALAPFHQLRTLQHRPDAATLRGWIEDPDLDVTRLGLYGVLLGLVGGQGDAEYLKQRISEPTTEFRLGIDGVIAGYLLLTGEAGLAVIDETKLKDPDGEFSETYAAMTALRFFWSETPGRIPDERLRESMRLLLNRSELADLAITDLARWKDWSVTDRLMELYDDSDYDIPSIKRAIIRFYLVESHFETDPETGKRSEYAVRSAQHLDNIRARDPDLIKQVERFYFLDRPVEPARRTLWSWNCWYSPGC